MKQAAGNAPVAKAFNDGGNTNTVKRRAFGDITNKGLSSGGGGGGGLKEGRKKTAPANIKVRVAALKKVAANKSMQRLAMEPEYTGSAGPTVQFSDHMEAELDLCIASLLHPLNVRAHVAHTSHMVHIVRRTWHTWNT